MHHTLRLASSLVAGGLLAAGTAGTAAAADITLTNLATAFNSAIGIAHFASVNKLLVSVNYSSGLPHNFEVVEPDGTHTPIFTSVSGLTDEIKIAVARDGSVSDFAPGTFFTGNGISGNILRINPGGTVLNPWVVLPGDPGLLRGSLHVDETGVYDGDLIVVTTGGFVFRVSEAGVATLIDSVGVHLEGVNTVPADVAKYGGLAGKIIAGAEGEGVLYVFDSTGFLTTYDVDVNIEDIDFIRADTNFYGVAFGIGAILGVADGAFDAHIGEILLTQEFPFAGTSGLYTVKWDPVAGAPVATEVTLTAASATPGQWEHVTFSTAGVKTIPPIDPPDFVDLVDLRAERRADAVRLEWTTATELACGTFEVRRCDLDGGSCGRTAHVAIDGARGIPCADSPAGATYSFVDTTADAAKSWSYLLVEFETTGDARVYGPLRMPSGAPVAIWQPGTQDDAGGPAPVIAPPSADVNGCASASSDASLVGLALGALLAVTRRRRRA